MKRFVFALCFALIPTLLLNAQSGLTSTTCPGTGCVQFQVDGARAVTFQVAGTFVATDVFEQSNDATNWQPLWLQAPTSIRSITGANPAATTEISETVPAGSRWTFKSLRAALVTNGTVATRNVQITFDDGTNTFASGGATFNQSASLTFTYFFNPGVTNAVQTSVIAQVPIPADVVLPAGYRIRTVTSAMQSGDDWAAPQYVVSEEISQTTAVGIWSGQIEGVRYVRHRLSAFTSGTALVSASASR